MGNKRAASAVLHISLGLLLVFTFVIDWQITAEKKAVESLYRQVEIARQEISYNQLALSYLVSAPASVPEQLTIFVADPSLDMSQEMQEYAYTVSQQYGIDYSAALNLMGAESQPDTTLSQISGKRDKSTRSHPFIANPEELIQVDLAAEPLYTEHR